MSLLDRLRPPEPSAPATTVVTLPRSRRRGPAGDVAAERLRRQQSKVEVDDGRPHGWGRAEDPEFLRSEKFGFLDHRRANGTPLLLFTVLAVLTGVGLARVESRIEILDVANEITELSGDQQRLLDRKRRLETERAYLRRPARVSEQATTRLGMEPAPPERIQRIELLPAATPEPEPEPESRSE
jgi:cell division protein FtsL